ncbi:serine/threonine protein kinase [Halalkaliarchaeum sp. AArc-GB]|uniref:serine/threonine protein kinase n=1 Tax=Halalkaliarchaeum sp. AArc-GB TaxID=3074078 RepID=UPI00285A9966|nr:serine/threonine protein kinase [Halalkaliarchaeum sp. AArc-GB]MDR5672992.1 serine/threonine protein kinase [Halalkaliarchaeum sp. AArc-GB]
MTLRRTNSYEAFGLSVVSEIPLPELATGDGSSQDDPDVIVRRGSVQNNGGENGAVSVTPEGDYRLTYEVASVLIRDGREIIVDSLDRAHGEIVRHVVVGPAFNHLLHQRGFFVLHASAVEIGDGAVVFAGTSGQGKTTTATAFLAAGHRVLSDDVAAIERVDEPTVHSGFPSIKLEPATVDRFGLSVDSPENICASRDRHFYGLHHEQPVEAVPLRRIYLLEDAQREEIAPAPASEQVLELIENTYTVSLHQESDYARENFTRAVSLAESVPVKRLRRRRRLDVLSDVIDLVEDDLGVRTERDIGERP